MVASGTFRRLRPTLIYPVVGASFGAALALLVTKALLEITFNNFFAVLFGVSLMGLALVIFYRAFAARKADSKTEDRQFTYASDAERAARGKVTKAQLLFMFRLRDFRGRVVHDPCRQEASAAASLASC